MRNLFKYLKPLDFVVVILALVLSVSLIATSGSREGRARKLILLYGEEKIPLSWRDQTINLRELVNRGMTVEVKDGRARVIKSNCPDLVCVHAGWVSDCGDMAICLPNGVALIVQCTDDTGESLHVTEP